MGELADREFNLSGWGAEKRLIEGPCGHCHHAVAFKEPDSSAVFCFNQTIRRDEEEYLQERSHYFVMGVCPRPRCQEPTIVYRLECRTRDGGGWREEELVQERVIYPLTSSRPDLPQDVPEPLRSLYREAASIENLSPNGSAFLSRRILEQVLRDRLAKPRELLKNLIDAFLETEKPGPDLHQLMEDVREFGNIAGHPAQDAQGQWTTVDREEATYTLDVVAEFLDFIFVRPKRIDAMRSRWKSKKKGESLPPGIETGLVIGGRAKPPVPSNDDLPF